MIRNLDSDFVFQLAAKHGLDSPTLVSPSLVVRSVDDDSVDIDIFSETPFYPACMMKVPLAFAAYNLISQGQLRPDQSIVIAEEDMTPTAFFSPFEPGFETNPITLIQAALRWSDNVAANTLIGVVGRHRATAIAHEYGMRRTFISRKLTGGQTLIDDPQATGRNAHPAIDAARAFELLATGQVPGAQEMLHFMRYQADEETQLLGIPDSDVYFHKRGWTSWVTHCGGILQTPSGRRYILVLYVPHGRTEDLVAKIGQFIGDLRRCL